MSLCSQSHFESYNLKDLLILMPTAKESSVCTSFKVSVMFIKGDSDERINVLINSSPLTWTVEGRC